MHRLANRIAEGACCLALMILQGCQTLVPTQSVASDKQSVITDTRPNIIVILTARDSVYRAIQPGRHFLVGLCLVLGLISAALGARRRGARQVSAHPADGPGKSQQLQAITPAIRRVIDGETGGDNE